MDFLIDLFGPDVFSIIHEYAGHIIEDLKFEKSTVLHQIQNEQERSIVSETYNRDYSIGRGDIKLFTIKIDNILYKIYNIITSNVNDGDVASVFIPKNLDYIEFYAYEKHSHHKHYKYIICHNNSKIIAHELLTWYKCNIYNLFPNFRWEFDNYPYKTKVWTK